MVKIKKYVNKEDFLRDRISMHFGSLTNLYSNSQNPPPPDELLKKAIEITEKVWEAGYQFDEFPELDEVLKEKVFEEYNLHERRIGRYYASELYDYFTNAIPPEKFLEPSLPSEEELRRLCWGTIVHEGLQKLFSYEEKEFEIQISNDIVIVCKPDLILPSGEVVEIKTKENISIYDKVPERYLYQLQAYLVATGQEKIRLYLIGWALTRRLFIVEKNNELWEKIVKNIKIYHQKVVQAYRERE